MFEQQLELQLRSAGIALGATAGSTGTTAGRQRKNSVKSHFPVRSFRELPNFLIPETNSRLKRFPLRNLIAHSPGAPDSSV